MIPPSSSGSVAGTPGASVGKARRRRNHPERKGHPWPEGPTNLRRHLVKAAVRLLTLAAVDLVGIAFARQFLRAVRGGLLGSGLADLANSFLADSVVHGPEIAVALIGALFFLECYRADLWRDPVRILAAAAVGVSVAQYADLWGGDVGVVLLRGLVIWVSLGAILVAIRSLAAKIARVIPRSGIGNRVLQVQPGDAPAVSLDLGPKYRTVATFSASSLPDDLEDMEDWLDGGVDTIVVAGAISSGKFGQLSDFAIAHGCRMLVNEQSFDPAGMEPRRVWVNGISFLELTAPSLRASQLLFKRSLDIAVALGLLLVLAPAMLILAVLVKLDTPGPVFFRQRRAGLGGRFFMLFKFRSMRADAEAFLRADARLYQKYLDNDFKLPEDEDPRVTRLGRFLRKTSLDELPQLLNVLRGDMSLVGPRPVVEPELEMYRGRIPTLLSVKPGLTGRWQVSGRSSVAFPERAELDLEYVRRWSLLEDLWILAMTVPVVLLRRGAH